MLNIIQLLLGLIGFGLFIWWLIVAFKVRVLWGLFFLIGPPVIMIGGGLGEAAGIRGSVIMALLAIMALPIVFVVKHWDQAKKPFICLVAHFVLSVGLTVFQVKSALDEVAELIESGEVTNEGPGVEGKPEGMNMLVFIFAKNFHLARNKALENQARAEGQATDESEAGQADDASKSDQEEQSSEEPQSGLGKIMAKAKETVEQAGKKEPKSDEPKSAETQIAEKSDTAKKVVAKAAMDADETKETPAPEPPAANTTHYAKAPPGYRVISIIGTDKRRTAMITGGGGKNYLVGKGDSLSVVLRGGDSQSLEIVDITDEAVIILLRGRAAPMAIYKPKGRLILPVKRGLPITAVGLALAFCSSPGLAASLNPLFATTDLNSGETKTIELPNGDSANVELLSIRETRGAVWGEIHRAEADVRVNGETATLISGMYRLPVEVGGVKIDCPITGGLKANSHIDHWALEKDARLRIWPEGSPAIRPGTFGYPVKQKWFASQTSFSNEPVAPRPARRLYYHAGLDIGGAEGLVDVLAATDAMVVSKGNEILAGHEKDTPIQKRYDVLYLLDDRGWYYRYSHLESFDPSVKLGERVKLGQRLGAIGKEGGSGGWTHLHFEIKSRQPSGRWGTQEGYAFLWQSYLERHEPDLIAIARPGHVVFAGQKATLDASKSWSRIGNVAKYEWIFSDGSRANGVRIERAYPNPGTYFETLKVTDSVGRIDYDFVRVKVFDRKEPNDQPPRLHAAYYPTFGIRAGQPVTFKVRSFYNTFGKEIWNFGDGSPEVWTKSDGNVKQLAKDGYSVITHTFPKPGQYLVRVRRANEKGHPSEDRLHVRVGE